MSSSINVLGIDHIGYFCSKPNELAEFFVQALGFVYLHMPEGDPATENGVIWLRFPDSKLELHLVPVALLLVQRSRQDLNLYCGEPGDNHCYCPPQNAIMLDHLALQVDDLAGTRRAWLEHGFAILDMPRTTNVGDSIYAVGPDGRTIEFIQRHSDP